MQLTTLSPPALIGDGCLWLFLYWGTLNWTLHDRQVAFTFLGGFMIFSKAVKLVTHFVRFPVDILLWPVSVFFGWFHGIIKWHAMFTVTEVSISFLRCQDVANHVTDYMGIASRSRFIRLGENGQAKPKVHGATALLRREGIHGENAARARLYEQASNGGLKLDLLRRWRLLDSRTAGSWLYADCTMAHLFYT